MNPYRIPDDQALPEPHDFAYHVFSTDSRVMEHARKKFEVPDEDRVDNVLLKQAVLRLWHLAKNAPRLARHDKGWASRPEYGWYDEAQVLSERVGKRWDSTPIPTLVEALADQELLQVMGFPRVTLQPRAMMHLTTFPYLVFRGRRLVLGDEATCRSLLIHDLRVGKNSHFCNSSPIPGACFSTLAFPFRLKLDTAQVSQCITLILENIETFEVTVSPMIYGVGLEEHELRKLYSIGVKS